MKKIIVLVISGFLLTLRVQEASAFTIRLPFRPFPTIPKPIIVLPTRIPRQIWKPFKPTATPTVPPSLTPTYTPTPTITPSSTPTPTLNVAPPYFKLGLANEAVPVLAGNSFEVKILINTGGVETINGDAVIIFDPSKINIVGAQSNNFYIFSYSTPIGDNKYLVSSWEESIAHAKKSAFDTPFATLTITAKEQGLTSISFDCTSGSETDTNINAIDLQDIVNCPLIPLYLNIES